MEAIELSIVINRPTEEVFAYLAKLEDDAKWRREWVEAKNTSGSPLGVSATFLLVAELLGRRIGTVYEATEYEPNRIAAWKAVSGPLPLTFQRTFEPIEGGTQVTTRYGGELRGFFKLVEPFVVGMGKRQIEVDLHKLKGLMEAGGL